MLIETRRKRKRLGGGAFTVADLPRPPRRAATQTPVDAAPVVTPRPPHQGAAEETQEEKEEESRSSESLTMTTVGTPSPPPPRLVDHRVLLARASRTQLMLLARLRCVNLRRARRAELLDEIARLKSIMATLQSEIDATTRNLESLEQLVHRLQQISFDSVGTIGGDAGPASRPTTATRVAPGTILWTNPALLASDGSSSSDTAAAQAKRLSRAAAEDARKAKTNSSGGRCLFPSSHPG